MKKIKYILIIIFLIIISFLFLLYKNIIKLPIGPNYMILEFINNYSIDENLINDSENIFVAKIFKNKGSGYNLPSTFYEAEVLYNIKGNVNDKVILEQEGGYEWGVLTIQKDDKLMKEGEIYILATNYNENKDYYVVLGHQNGKYLLDTGDLELIKNNSRVKELENVVSEINFKSNEQIAKENGYYYKSIIAEEKEFTFNNTIENNNLDYEDSNEIKYSFLRGERPICPGMPNKESCVKDGFGAIYNRYTIGNDIYDLVFDSNNKQFQNNNKYLIFKNDELIFEDNIEMVGAWSPYMSYNYDGKVLFVYTKNKGDDTVLYNIFYDLEYINKNYDFENIDQYFVYKGKEGFIVDKNKIFFNGQMLPYSFDYIQNRACCTSPSLFKLYDNGKLIFANKRGDNIDNLEFDIIELDLNDYVD